MPSLRTALSATAALFAAAAIAHPLDELAERANSRFEFYDLPTPLSGPCDLTPDSDGYLWGEDILVNKIFRLDPHTKAVKEFSIPFTTPLSNNSIPVISGVSKEVGDRIAFSCAIRNATDGNIYAGNGVNNQLVRINPKTKAIKVFTPGTTNPLGNAFPFNDLFSADNGIYLTQTTGNVFQFFDFQTEKFTTYKVPTAGALPLGCFVASNGFVYIAELMANKILVFNPTTKAINEYDLPALAQFPAVIRAEHDGYVYFSLFIGNGIGRINMQTNDIELFHTDQLLNAGSEVTGDANGGVWLSSFTINALSRLDTETLKFTYVNFPETFASGGANGITGDIPPYVDVAVNYGPTNSIWFTSILKNAVGRYKLDGLY